MSDVLSAVIKRLGRAVTVVDVPQGADVTSWRKEYCGNPGALHARHMIDSDADGNAVCVRPRCGHVAEIACTCRLDPDWTKYIGCPKHTRNARMPIRYPRNGSWSADYQAASPWFPENMGGDLSLEDADQLARELVHKR